MIDLHCHVLPGFDDGVRSLDEARQLARSAVADGVTAIAATPHVRDEFPTTAERMERGVAALRSDFADEGIDVELVPGGEVALDRLWSMSDDEIRRFTYGGAGRYLLVEFPYRGWPQLLEQTVAALRSNGICALLAHPERNDAVQADPPRVAQLLEAGAGVQVTASSLSADANSRVGGTARRLLSAGLVDVVATDAHGPHVAGRTALSAVVPAIGDPALARRLTLEAPAAVVAGEAIEAYRVAARGT